VPAPRGSGRGGQRALARGGTDGVALVGGCGRSGFGAGSYARLSATSLVTTTKLCPRGHRWWQGLAPASLAECDTLTDFPDTPTDFRDTRRIFAAPCAIRCDHRSPLSLTDYRNFITGARAGIGRPPREIGDPFASRPPVPISRPCSTNPPGSFAPPTPRIRPDSCDVIGFVSQFLANLNSPAPTTTRAAARRCSKPRPGARSSGTRLFCIGEVGRVLLVRRSARPPDDVV
jgi:hypothetical protein